MRSRSLLPLLAALALLTPAVLMAQSSGEGSVAVSYGTVPPDAALEDLDGNPVKLSDYIAGKPAVLEFWATWCENCEALQPQMDRIQEMYGDEVAVVAVAVAVAQSVRRVKRHLSSHDPGYPYLYDVDGAAVRAYEAFTTSVVVMLDAEGKVVYTGTGGGQDLMGAVERLVGSD